MLGTLQKLGLKLPHNKFKTTKRCVIHLNELKMYARFSDYIFQFE